MIVADGFFLRLDLSTLQPESVDILLRIAPSAEELQTFKDYEAKQSALTALTDEDQFLAQVGENFLICLRQLLQVNVHLRFFSWLRSNVWSTSCVSCSLWEASRKVPT
jgi:hypothetical protein